MARVVVIGKNSFLARRFLALSSLETVAVSHDELDTPGLFDDAACVVNFALDPRMMREPYAVERDLDVRIAEKIAGSSTRFVMMSTRMVYGPDHCLGAVESAAAVGLNQYGANKLETEGCLRALLGDRVTIVRLSNVLGWEISRGHPSFILRVLGKLRESATIEYDISPFTRKDFVTETYFVNVLDQACNSPRGGTYNVGSGIPLEVGRVAMWVLEGHGKGSFVVTSPRVHDEFWLDMTNTSAHFGLPPTLDELRAACRALGTQVLA